MFRWVKEEPKLPYCESCNILFTNPKDLAIHNQQTHRSSATLIIPSLQPIETVFYNEVEITKKKKPIKNKPPITKIIPKGATTTTQHILAAPKPPGLTIIKPNTLKILRPSPPIIKPSPAPKSALEQIMTSQVI